MSFKFQGRCYNSVGILCMVRYGPHKKRGNLAVGLAMEPIERPLIRWTAKHKTHMKYNQDPQ